MGEGQSRIAIHYGSVKGYYAAWARLGQYYGSRWP